jgi:tyrosine aminotransferase
MESLIDEKTKAILVNNPSNPCGSNFSADHLSAIIGIAEKYNLPIIADEIYSGLVFEGEFVPIQTVRRNVPLLTVGGSCNVSLRWGVVNMFVTFAGIAKEFVVPGWRVGWIVVHDHTGRLSEVRKGLRNLTQLVLGTTSYYVPCKD